jgi:hypothetical protein
MNCLGYRQIALLAFQMYLIRVSTGARLLLILIINIIIIINGSTVHLLDLGCFFRLLILYIVGDRHCGLVVRVLGYRFGGPGSIPATTRKKSSGSGTGSTQPREHNWEATW